MVILNGLHRVQFFLKRSHMIKNYILCNQNMLGNVVIPFCCHIFIIMILQRQFTNKTDFQEILHKFQQQQSSSEMKTNVCLCWQVLWNWCFTERNFMFTTTGQLQILKDKPYNVKYTTTKKMSSSMFLPFYISWTVWFTS